MGRIDQGLAAHLEKQGVEFIQFGFRWINCLLMREVPSKLVIRMWDTYLVWNTMSERSGAKRVSLVLFYSVIVFYLVILLSIYSL
jgi:hypothetical protein